MSKVQHLFKSKTSGGAKRKYGKLNLKQKIEIIKAAEMGLSQRALASRYNCGKTQIHLLVTQKAMWLDKWERSQNKRMPEDTHFPEEAKLYYDLNDLVFDFYAKLTSTGIPVSGAMLQERAVQVAKELQQVGFDADHDWLDMFVSQYEIVLADNDDNNLILLRNIGSRIKDDALLQNYDFSDIYNLGEVRLPYKFVPNDTNPIKPSTIKDYLTVSLCYNAVGGKEAELVVYDSSQFSEVNLDLRSQCVSNWKGMMTQRLYEKRLTEINADMARQNRHILLLVDESKFSGSLECTMSNVKVKPTSVCLISQPMLCGIGHMFKFLYCRRLLRMLVAHMSAEENGVELAEKLSLNKAVRLIQCAWDDLQPKTIVSSFYEAGLKHLKNDSEDFNQLSECDEALILEIKNLVAIVRKQGTGEDLSDDVFTHLIEDGVCSNTTSDCSDSDEDTSSQSTFNKIHTNSYEGMQLQSTNASYVVNQSKIVDMPSVNSLIGDAFSSISKMDCLAGVICNKDQLQKARMLLNELEDLFEDSIVDYQFQSLSKQTV